MHKHAKAYLFHIFGGRLFTNLNGTHMPLFYIQLLKNSESIPLVDTGICVLQAWKGQNKLWNACSIYILFSYVTFAVGF
jgi:hypothetical protein